MATEDTPTPDSNQAPDGFNQAQGDFSQADEFDQYANGIPPAPVVDPLEVERADREAERLADKNARRSAYQSTKGTRSAAAWTGLVVGSLVSILLLVFIVQNLSTQKVQFLAWEISLPLGVLILGAAIAGALIAAFIAGIRIFQLRRTAKKLAR